MIYLFMTLFFIIVIFACFAYKRVKISSNFYLVISVFFVVLCSCIVFSFITGTYNSVDVNEVYEKSMLDLSRYHIEINSLRDKGLKEFFQLSLSVNEPLRYWVYKIVMFLGSNNWYQVLTVILGLFPLLYFCRKYGENEGKVSFDIVFASCVFLFSYINFFDFLNTNRSIMAYSMVALGTYCLYVKKQRMAYVYIVVASLLHMSCWLFLGIIVLQRILPFFRKFYFVAFLMWKLWALIVINMLKFLNVAIIQRFVFKVEKQLLNEPVGGKLIYWLGMFIAGMCLFFLLEWVKKKEKNQNEIKLLEFIEIVLLAALGGWRTNLCIRFFFLIAMFSPIIVKKIQFLNKNSRYYILNIVFWGASVFVLIYNTAKYAYICYLSGSGWRIF